MFAGFGVRVFCHVRKSHCDVAATLEIRYENCSHPQKALIAMVEV